MDDLLTSRQVQDILKVDRITVYRMLNDGRLKGVKIGQQWRFPRREVDRLLAGETAVEPVAAAADPTFPVHCVQTVQDLFADVGQISAVVLDMQGELLTAVSRPSVLYQLLQENQQGREAFRAAWRSFVEGSRSGLRYFTDPTGMQYIAAPVLDRGEPVALFLAGQFYWQSSNEQEREERLRQLSIASGLPLERLQQAARQVPVISTERQPQVEAWPFAAARAVQSILSERTSFMERLQQIAHLTQIS